VWVELGISGSLIFKMMGEGILNFFVLGGLLRRFFLEKGLDGLKGLSDGVST
jgi:hypothetical protein